MELDHGRFVLSIACYVQFSPNFIYKSLVLLYNIYILFWKD